MIEILHTEKVSAPKEVVWDVIADIDAYPEWNTFVVGCKSSLEVGKPIMMWVRVLPWFAMPQRETVFAHRAGEFLEYGIKLPLGMLRSSRQHVVTAVDENHAQYDSIFRLQGWFAPVVKLLLKGQLQRGFNDMTSGVVARAEAKATDTK